tara:strand:+ start:281 stop:751 length:471 start_codon:yes stop_codon:yes gene_type:complete
MRENKFRFWLKNDESMVGWFDAIDSVGGIEYFMLSDEVQRLQCTGLTDINGVDIHDGDIVNVCYESNEYIFDGKYIVDFSCEGVSFRFAGLMWESDGHNQTPYEKLELAGYGLLIYDFKSESKGERLCISPTRKFKYSNYIKVIGNTHQNPDLVSD